MRILPVVMRWQGVEIIDDETGLAVRRMAMVPLARYDNLAKRQYHPDEDYPLVPLEPRSRASHSQYFAELNEIFENLPEDLQPIAARLGIKTIPPGGFIDNEHFRKWALAEVGYCEITEFDFDKATDARMVALKWRKKDPYAQIIVRGSHVTIKEAVSQSAAAMSKEPFEDSKRKVLDLGQAMIGVTREELKKQARQSA